jgi:hypothetical protein
LNGIHLFDGFRSSVEGENLVTFFPTKGDDDFDHRGLVIDDYDFSHSQRGEYFSFEKKKEEMREKLRSQGAFTMEHDPWNFRIEIENYFLRVAERYKRQSNHIR